MMNDGCKYLLGRVINFEGKTCLVLETKQQRFRDKGYFLYLWDLTNNLFISNIFFGKETSMEFIYSFDDIDFINKRKIEYVICLNKGTQEIMIEKKSLPRIMNEERLKVLKRMFNKSGDKIRRFYEKEIVKV